MGGLLQKFPGGSAITQYDRVQHQDDGGEIQNADYQQSSQYIRNQSGSRQGEEKYQELLEQVNDIVFRMSIEGILTEVSPSVTPILGYTPEDVIGQGISTFISLESLEIIRYEIAKKIQNPEMGSRYEIPIRARDGRMVTCEINSRIIRRPEGPLEILGIIRDTTERRRMEDSIRISERKYREIFTNAVEGMFRCSGEGRILEVNPSFATVFGYANPAEVISHVSHISQLYKDGVNKGDIIRQLKERPVIRNVHLEIIHVSGETRWVRINARLVTGLDADTIEGSVMDITDQILLEKSLTEKERVYHLLADNISDVIWTADMDMHVTYMSPSVMKLRGFPVDIASKQPLHEVYTPESLNTLLRLREEGMDLLMKGEIDGEHPQYLELGMYHRDGHVIWTETVISLIFSAEHIPVGVVGSIRNISARKKAERAHQESQVRLMEAQKLAHVGDWELSPDTGCLICSDEMFRIFGVAPDTGFLSLIRYFEAVHPEDREELGRVFNDAIVNHQAIETIHRIILPDGSIKHLHVRGRARIYEAGVPEKIAGTIQDITERMSLEEERANLMKQIQRNIAELTILNDGIRNPLAIIEAILEVDPEGGNEAIRRQIGRIDAMISQLDKRWAESEKIFSYLQKHYGISS